MLLLMIGTVIPSTPPPGMMMMGTVNISFAHVSVAMCPRPTPSRTVPFRPLIMNPPEMSKGLLLTDSGRERRRVAREKRGDLHS